jgi:hypothetical protein
MSCPPNSNGPRLSVFSRMIFLVGRFAVLPNPWRLWVFFFIAFAIRHGIRWTDVTSATAPTGYALLGSINAPVLVSASKAIARVTVSSTATMVKMSSIVQRLHGLAGHSRMEFVIADMSISALHLLIWSTPKRIDPALMWYRRATDISIVWAHVMNGTSTLVWTITKCWVIGSSAVMVRA